jgi:hypothetical protein
MDPPISRLENRLCVEMLSNFDHLPPEAIVSFQQIGDLIATIHHGRMIAPAERLADLRQGDIRL